MKITSVLGPKPSGLYVITDDRGTRYATTSALKASLAKRALETGKDVEILDARGWYYRELLTIQIVDQKEQCA